jgi:GGDEF domain-containing protein
LVKIICERIVRAFQNARHEAGANNDLAVTISVGMATQCAKRNFESTDVFVSAADKALYSAKLQGRNRSIAFDLIEHLDVAQM